MRIVSIALAALAALFVAAPAATQAQAQNQGAATLKVIHASAGAPGVDIYVDGQEALDSRDFFSEGTVSLQPGWREVRVVRDGESADATLVGKLVKARPGEAYTLALIGEGESLRGLFLKDSTSAPEPDEARVRIIHAATGAGAVDVAVAGSTPFLEDVVFGSATYVDVPTGAYNLALSDAASGAELLQTVDLSFTPGWTYTLVVTGQSADDLWVQAMIDRGE